MMQRDLMFEDSPLSYTEQQECNLTEQKVDNVWPEPTPERAAANMADSKYPIGIKVAIAVGIAAFVYFLLTM